MSANPTRNLTKGQLRIVREIRRVAKTLDQRCLSQSEFDKHHDLGGVSTAGYQFGSWNEAVKAAGLEPQPSGGTHRSRYPDKDLLEEIIRVHRQLGKPPSERKMARFGRYSLKPYEDRWGSLSKARQEAYARFGWPDTG